MKKLIILILGIAFVYSCSTSSDGNGNTTAAPVPPSNLTGTVASSTQINLSWTDNSTNETGFKIERKTGSGTYAVVGTTATNVTTFNDNGLTASTTYTYRVYSYNAGGNSPSYSNEITLSVNIITSNITSITSCTAISGATISGYVGSTITARGVCWSTNNNPTITLSTKTIDGTGIGIFTSNISGLTANTTYFVRAYATTSLGTDYGNEYSLTTKSINVPGSNITDLDGNVYNTISNCGQTWMKSNLNVTRYRNGDIIPQITNVSQWGSTTTGAWCYYNNDPANEAIYGKLYNSYAVKDPRGLAPIGYHIPSELEWTSLIDCLGMGSVAGAKLKSSGTTYWSSPNTANNSSGFTALPGGTRRVITNHTFTYIGEYAFFWTNTSWNSTSGSSYSQLGPTNTANTLGASNNMRDGYYVRCVKD
jgi:uncharacterized protein (TIGR02145 family)